MAVALHQGSSIPPLGGVGGRKLDLEMIYEEDGCSSMMEEDDPVIVRYGFT